HSKIHKTETQKDKLIAHYKLKRKWRQEQLDAELYKAEIEDDVVAFVRAEESAKRDLDILDLEFQLQSEAQTPEIEYLIKRKIILRELEYHLRLAESNNNVSEFVKLQNNAERVAWQLEDEYEAFYNDFNWQIVIQALYEES